MNVQYSVTNPAAEFFFNPFDAAMSSTWAYACDPEFGDQPAEVLEHLFCAALYTLLSAGLTGDGFVILAAELCRNSQKFMPRCGDAGVLMPFVLWVLLRRPPQWRHATCNVMLDLPLAKAIDELRVLAKAGSLTAGNRCAKALLEELDRPQIKTCCPDVLEAMQKSARTPPGDCVECSRRGFQRGLLSFVERLESD